MKAYTLTHIETALAIRKATGQSVRNIGSILSIPKSVIGRWVRDPEKYLVKYIKPPEDLKITIKPIEYPPRYMWKRKDIDIKDYKPDKFVSYQMTLVADYQDEKTEEIMENVESFSESSDKIDADEMLIQATRHAQGLLGGSNWIIIKIYEITYQEYYQIPLPISKQMRARL